jgi:hypothetical protein
MLTKIIGAVNSGKTHFGILTILKKSYFDKSCIISTELGEKRIMERVKNFVENESIDEDSMQDLRVKFMSLPKQSDIKDYIVKLCDEGYKNFLIDNASLVVREKREMTIQETLNQMVDFYYNLSMQYDCNIYISYSLNRDTINKSIKELYENFDKDNLREFENIIFVKSELSQDNQSICRKALDIQNQEVDYFHIESFFQKQMA